MAELWKPNSGPQTAFLQSTVQEVLYGGAVYGGKSEAITVLPLRFIEHPKHRAIILRRTRPQLQETIDRTLQLYPNVAPGAEWREKEERWRFPSGAIIQMGHAEHEKDIMQFKSFEYNLICFDELTSFTEYQYAFMTLRNRTKSRDLPLWIRSGTNPGDVGHEWVFNRFIKDRDPYKVYSELVTYGGTSTIISRQFIPSSVYDNRAMAKADRDAYIAKIVSTLPPEDVSAYLGGDWSKLAGAMFKTRMVEAIGRELLDSQNYMVIRSIDYGWEDHTCVLWLAFYPTKGVIDVIGEIYVNHTTIDGIAHYIHEKEKELGLRSVMWCVGSPEMGNIQATSGQSISSMLGQHGIYVEQGNKDRIGGWARLLNMIENKAIRVWPQAAPNLTRTLYVLQRGSGLGKNPNDVSKGQEDHAADALRYGVMAAYDRPAITPQKAPDPDDPNRDNVYPKLMKDLQESHKNPWVQDLGYWG